MSEPFLGEIRMVGFNFAPQGWAFCQGQLMSIAQNSALFSLLGTTFGGDGQTTFALPDYRGRSSVGMGSGPGLTNIVQGEKSGTENVTILSTQMPVHTHAATATVSIPAVTASTNVTAVPSETSVLGPIAAGGRAGSLYTTDTPNTGLLPFSPPITVTPAGGSQPVPVRNPYLGTNFIIATEGIFPSRP
ncbi:MAG TPA: tail fiber protein [Burkholderiales bacterium]|nr:tail fiber protein [Burkholderiales bacterium]